MCIQDRNYILQREKSNKENKYTMEKLRTVTKKELQIVTGFLPVFPNKVSLVNVIFVDKNLGDLGLLGRGPNYSV